MEIIRGHHNIQQRHHGCVVTVGNFDGLHLGHQQLLQSLISHSKRFQLPSLVILFEPQANEFFSTQKNTPRLMRFREKIMGLKSVGIDRVLCIHFNDSFALLEASDFVEKILVEKLGIRFILVGDDFHFGYKRKGNVTLLKEFGKQYQFDIEEKETFKINSERVSSTRVRHLLEQGDLKKAQTLLGRTFSLCGRVVHGDKRGRLLGFPTANIYLHRRYSPLLGVFAVHLIGADGILVQGVANIGIRPTISGKTHIILEVHLFNFQRDIYSQEVEVRFLRKLRDEKKFTSLELLQEQIALDVEQAHQFFALE